MNQPDGSGNVRLERPVRRGTKDYAYWLADKIPGFGDYGKDCADCLREQADKIEKLDAALTRNSNPRLSPGVGIEAGFDERPLGATQPVSSALACGTDRTPITYYHP